MVAIEIISRENIKPSFPTPHHLRNFKVSFIDQTAPLMYTSILLFYTNSDHVKATQKSQQLKTSLSKMLTGFYPLAGMIKDQTTIECNDEGAEYIEARVKCSLSDILQKPDHFLFRKFIPVEIESHPTDGGRVLFVQANFFDCGGIAIGVCSSHKITDAATLGIILNSWAKVAKPMHEPILFPSFNTSASIFPPICSPTPPIKILPDKSVIMKRFVFDASKIVALKAKAASPNEQQPSRVEAVTALLWKCAIKTLKSSLRIAMLHHAVNLRKKVVPENTFGNNVGTLSVAQATNEEIDLQCLVSKIKKGIREFNKRDLLHTINVEKRTWLNMCEIENLNEGVDIDFFGYSSWCRFPFYEVDFGWGKPTWVTIPTTMIKNGTFFLDTKDGEGIEALVMMSREDMAEFECDQELLQFAALNPSVDS